MTSPSKDIVEHTLTPWTVEFGDGHGRCDIHSEEMCGFDGSKIVARCHLPERPNRTYDFEQAETNAAFIVRAVNRDHHFDDLVRALQRIADLRYAEDSGEPLDDAIWLADKALSRIKTEG